MEKRQSRRSYPREVVLEVLHDSYDHPTAYTKVYPGQFVIYFPSDGHAPGIGQGTIRKAVIKIPVNI